MADWLALHQLTPRVARRLVQAFPAATEEPQAEASASVRYGPEAVWKACGHVALEKMPAARARIETVLSDVRVNFAPDPARHPRAFTLHDDGAGMPYVSCPWQGCLGDTLAVAHEFGHALQIVASGGQSMPPVLRETCASLSEHWLGGTPDALGPDNSDRLAALVRQNATRRFAREAPVLDAALNDPHTPYGYRWNYPLALSLTFQCQTRLGSGEIWSIFRNKQSIPELVTRLLD